MLRKLRRYSFTALSAAAFVSAFASNSAEAQRTWSSNAGAPTNRPMLSRPAQPLQRGTYVFTTTPDPAQNAGAGGYPTYIKIKRNAGKPAIAKANSIKASSIPQLRPNSA